MPSWLHSLHHRTTNTAEQSKTIKGWWRDGGHRMAPGSPQARHEVQESHWWKTTEIPKSSQCLTLRLTVGHVSSWNLTSRGRHEHGWGFFSSRLGNVAQNWIHYRALWGKLEGKQRAEPQIHFLLSLDYSSLTDWVSMKNLGNFSSIRSIRDSEWKGRQKGELS